MKLQLLNYLERFLMQNNWDDKYTKEQARSIFTTICLVENIDADTAECDGILAHLYVKAEIDELCSFDDEGDEDSFYNYMVELIV